MKKKTILITVLIITLIIIISIFTYIFLKKGNNISNKSDEDKVENILNIKGYNATLEIEVQTNKNKTKYVVEQSFKDGNISRQEIIEPKNIAGVVTEYDGITLKITNNNLNLSTTFENYNYIVDNNLWLNSFIKSYKENSNSKLSRKNDEIVLEIKDQNGNKYGVYKKLYIDANTRQTYQINSPRY